MKHIPTFEDFINEHNELLNENSNFIVGQIYTHPIFGKFEVIELGRNQNTKVKFLEGRAKGDISFIAGWSDEGYLKESEEFLNEDAGTLLILLQAAMVGGQIALFANAGSDFHPIDDLKMWWKEHKRDKAVETILDKLKDDQEVIEFLQLPKAKQEGQWKKLIAPKLTADELKYINSVSRDRVKAGKIT
jgi:hypothetical protein